MIYDDIGVMIRDAYMLACNAIRIDDPNKHEKVAW